MNEQFNAARLAAVNPATGHPFSRGELAEAVRAWVLQHLGEACAFDESHVGKLERGDILWPAERYRRALRAVLGGETDRDLGFRRRSQLPTECLPESRDVVASLNRIPDAHTGTDHGLAHLLAGLLADDLPTIEQGSIPALVGVCAVGERSLRDSCDLLLRLFLQLDDELGGDTLYKPLSRYVARLAVNAQTNPGDGLPAFGQLSQMAGWLALDGNRHAEARRYLTTSVYVAHQTDQPDLAASALAYMSLQETYRGQPNSALALAETAWTTAAGRVSRLVTTMLATRLARAHASLGDVDQCLRFMEEARGTFAEPSTVEEPIWVSYVDEVEVTAQEGACYLGLSMTDQAAACLQRAMRLLENTAPHRVRDRTHYLTRLAKCHLADEEIGQACVVAGEALDLSQAVDSARVAERLREVSDALAPYEANAEAHSFRERFALAAPA